VGDITVIDTATHTVVGSIAVPDGARNLAVDEQRAVLRPGWCMPPGAVH
jgi:DNA-binding beta-propeller fold protein YncE